MHRPIVSRRLRRAVVPIISAAVIVVTAAACWSAGVPVGPNGDPGPPPPVDGAPFRAFTADSFWNTPVPADAPSHPRAAKILDYLRTAPQAGDGCVRLAGAQDSSWGQPVYWARPTDPEYDVDVRTADDPPELNSMRIPAGAHAAENSDGSMTIFDLERGYTVAFTDAVYDADADAWTANGATVTYLDSNGLHARTGMASDQRNLGSHRGNNPAVMMVRLDEVAAGEVRHVLKVASGPELSTAHVFPMVGSDGDSTDPRAPAQGLRLRIRPSVELEGMQLGPEALVIASAMQRYGIYLGDSAGVTALKLEDTRVEGRGQLWSLPPTALCSLPLSTEIWDVLPAGYG